MSEQPAPEQQPPTPIKLDGEYQRSSVGLVGCGFLVVGTVAVFKTDSEAGPVALLAIGILLFIIAIAGQLPTRFKFGETEIELGALREFVQETIEDASPEERPEVLRRVANLAAQAPGVAGSAVAAALSEQAMIQSIRHAAAIAIPDALVEEGGTETPFDLVVRSHKTNRTVAVEILNGRNSARLRKITKLYLTLRESLGYDHLVVIARGSVGPGALEAVEQVTNFSLVGVGDQEPSELIVVRAISEALQPPTK